MAAPDAPVTLHTILDQFRADARSNRDLGDRFERMMFRYFELDPLYADRFSNVWMWNDWPSKGSVGDVGIDLVARSAPPVNTAASSASSTCPSTPSSKQDLDSFFTALGKPAFSSGMVVSTTDSWGKERRRRVEPNQARHAPERPRSRSQPNRLVEVRH